MKKTILALLITSFLFSTSSHYIARAEETSEDQSRAQVVSPAATELSFSNEKEVVEFFESYIKQFCSNNDGWEYWGSASDVESGLGACIFLYKDGFYSDLAHNGLTDQNVQSVVDSINNFTSELYQLLKPFHLSAGICLMKSMEEDVVYYWSLNGEEFLQGYKYTGADQNYIYSGLVDIPSIPLGNSSADTIKNLSAFLEDYCATHDGWQYQDTIEADGKSKACIFCIAREGFEERIVSNGLADPFVDETIKICNDFSHLFSESLFPYRVYISSLFLNRYDNPSDGIYYARDGREIDFLEHYIPIQEIFGRGSSSTSVNSDQSKFSNKYGNENTICAHPGCNNPIASSGDT